MIQYCTLHEVVCKREDYLLYMYTVCLIALLVTLEVVHIIEVLVCVAVFLV